MLRISEHWSRSFAVANRTVIKIQEKYTALGAFTVSQDLHCNVYLLLRTYELG